MRFTYANISQVLLLKFILNKVVYTTYSLYIYIMEFNNIDRFNPRTCFSGQITRINRSIANIFRAYLKPFDVTNSQLTILFILSKRPGINQKQLSDMAVLEKSSLNRNLKRLFDKNYISRKDLPSLTLTQQGKTFVNDIIPEWEKAMQDVRTVLGEEGEHALETLHRKLILSKS